MTVHEFRAAQNRVLERFGVSAESRFIDRSDAQGKAHVLEMGAGPPVVLLNGLGTPGAMWAPLMAELKGFTLHAVDLPGFGLTDADLEITGDHRSAAVSFLEDILDGLGLAEATFISNSLGSLWSLWLALDRPDRVKAMAHIGCPAIVLDTSVPFPMRIMSVPLAARILNRLQPPSAKQVEQLSKMVGQHRLTPEIAEVLLATERMPHFDSAFQNTLRTLVRFRGPRAEMRLTARDFNQVPHPTQLIWGRDDPFGSPSQGERLDAALPNSTLHVVDGGHAPWLNDPSHIGHILSKALDPAQ